jgi:hypothetical protein
LFQDEKLRKIPEVVNGEDKSGTTAVCALISEKYIIFSNCGDSRGVLSGDGSRPVLATQDHKPSNPPERERIQVIITWRKFTVRVTGSCFGIVEECEKVIEKQKHPWFEASLVKQIIQVTITWCKFTFRVMKSHRGCEKIEKIPSLIPPLANK